MRERSRAARQEVAREIRIDADLAHGRCRHTNPGPANPGPAVAPACAETYDRAREGHHVIKNPIPWPGGAGCAVALTFDMDAESLLHPS